MSKGFKDCIICGKDTYGRGTYEFRYLSEEVGLCGTHAQEVMKFIKSRCPQKKEAKG